MTASPSGSLRTNDWVVLNCSFSRPDLPDSVHWFRGPGRIPVQESAHHHLVGSFLFLPQVSPLDSGPWSCVLTYGDGFNVSITYNLSVLGNSPSLPSHLTTTPSCPPCHLPLTYGSSKAGLQQLMAPAIAPDLILQPFSPSHCSLSTAFSPSRLSLGHPASLAILWSPAGPAHILSFRAPSVNPPCSAP